jgi:site-specific recombinase XerD
LSGVEEPATSRGWLLFWTGRQPAVSEALHPLLGEFQDLERREAQRGIVAGTPILVAPDASIDERLSLFFSAPTFAMLSRGSREAYAKDIRLWVAYLASRGLDWTDADDEDVLRYKTWRRRGDLNRRSIGGAKWDRERAALTKLYRWAAHPRRAYVAFNPMVGGVDAGYGFADDDRVVSRVRWVTPRTYRMWRDVGLLGYGPDGLRDPSWRGRNSARNRAYADLLFGSGLRSREGASLLTIEIPDGSTDARMHEGHLARSTAKRRARAFYLLDDALARVHEYQRTSRAAAVRRARRGGFYEGDSWVRVTKVRLGRSREVHVYGRWERLDNLDVDTRMRLLFVSDAGPEPMWFWLTEAGMPFGPTSWRNVFETANEQVDRGLADRTPPRLTAHSLRHSYALYMLIALQRAIDRRAADGRSANFSDDRYRLAWDIVRDLLGHASVNTTRNIYLEPVNGLRLHELLADDGDLETVLGRLAMSDARVRDLSVSE